MAISPAHRFGQIIGDLLETAVESVLTVSAAKHSLFLDKKGPRPAREGSKVSWIDVNKNKHDLDFVLERGGTPDKHGVPVAFIEAAWRRYTKHSKNKAQEIQGAIGPLCEAYRHYHPFIGVVLAGVFTKNSLTQLQSLGFIVAYFPYETIKQAFAIVGIDASTEEGTPDKEIAKKCKSWDALKLTEKAKVAKELVRINAGEIKSFIEALEKVIQRTIRTVRILPLHGAAAELTSVKDAIAFILKYDEEGPAFPVVRYEVQIVYINEDRICAEFAAKVDAVEFLKTFSSSAGGPSAHP